MLWCLVGALFGLCFYCVLLVLSLLWHIPGRCKIFVAFMSLFGFHLHSIFYTATCELLLDRLHYWVGVSLCYIFPSRLPGTPPELQLARKSPIHRWYKTSRQSIYLSFHKRRASVTRWSIQADPLFLAMRSLSYSTRNRGIKHEPPPEQIRYQVRSTYPSPWRWHRLLPCDFTTPSNLGTNSLILRTISILETDLS